MVGLIPSLFGAHRGADVHTCHFLLSLPRISNFHFLPWTSVFPQVTTTFTSCHNYMAPRRDVTHSQAGANLKAPTQGKNLPPPANLMLED